MVCRWLQDSRVAGPGIRQIQTSQPRYSHLDPGIAGPSVSLLVGATVRGFATRVKSHANPSHTMGDTKRGRERKGQKKREQQRRQEIEETLDAEEEPPDPETDEEIEFGSEE